MIKRVNLITAIAAILLAGTIEAQNKHYISVAESIDIAVVHQIRNSCLYVVWKEKKEFTSDLKLIYNVPIKESASHGLDLFEQNGAQNTLMPFAHGATIGMN